MSSGMSSFLAGFLSFTGYLVAILFVTRLRMKVGWFTLQILIGGIVHVLFTILFLVLIKGFIYWYALGIYAVGWFCFFTLSTAIYVSISARILRNIYDAADQTLTKDKIFEICVRRPFEERAIFLVRTDQVRKRETGYQVTSKGKKNVQRIQFMRNLLNLDGSGLYSLEETLNPKKRK